MLAGGDGGWNTPTFSIDNSKLYRFSVWVKRNETNNGRFYLGCRGYGSASGVLSRSNGNNYTNPYFYSNVTGITPGRWELIVGHVWPAGSGTGSMHSESGRYTVDGKYANISTDFVWRPETTTSLHRSYLFYTTNTAQRQWWVYPRVDVVDGTEPSIQELLDGFDSYGHSVTASVSENKASVSLWYKNRNDSEWTHVVDTPSGFYVDASSSSPSTYPVVISGNNVHLGRTSLSDYFDGDLDEVRIYNRELSEDEIGWLYNAYRPQAIINSSSPQVSPSLQNGLVLDMPLTLNYTKDETAGSEVMADRSAYDNHGQNYGATLNSEGTLFADSNDYISFAAIDFADGEPHSGSAWMKWEESSSRSTIPFGDLSSCSNAVYVYASAFYFRPGGMSGTLVTYWGGSIFNGDWHHLVWTVDESKMVRVYLDGDFMGSLSFSGATTQIRYRTAGRSYCNTSYTWGGYISNFKIYNRALSSSEIELLYFRGR